MFGKHQYRAPISRYTNLTQTAKRHDTIADGMALSATAANNSRHHAQFRQDRRDIGFNGLPRRASHPRPPRPARHGRVAEIRPLHTTEELYRREVAQNEHPVLRHQIVASARQPTAARHHGVLIAILLSVALLVILLAALGP
jgi:hypothetical protein